MLLVWLTLPNVDAVGAKDVDNLTANFSLSAVADEFVRSSPLTDLVFKRVDKLFISLHTVDVGKESVVTNNKMSRGVSAYTVLVATGSLRQ
jgi:hypothetical protein